MTSSIESVQQSGTEKRKASAGTEAIQETRPTDSSLDVAQKIGNGVLTPITSRVRTDKTAIKKPDGSTSWTQAPLTDVNLSAHLNGGTPRGCCPIKAGESVTRLGLFDLDSHKGESSWDEMVSEAGKLIDVLELIHGATPIPWRSSGGRGIHVFLLWDEPQDARSVRQFMDSVLKSIEYRNGTGGIAAGEIEIFPKQDAVASDGSGNMFILPLAGKSVPLVRKAGTLEPAPREWALTMEWPASPAVPHVEAPAPREKSSGDYAHDMASRALMTIPNDFDRDTWFKVLCAFKEAAGEDGYASALEWSAQHNTHEDANFDKCWNSITEGRTGGAPADYLFHVAEQHGFIEHITACFEPIVLTPEEAAESEHWRQKNEEKAQRQADAAIKRAKSMAEEAVISFVDFAVLAHTLPPPRKWVVQEWLPRGSVTTLFGRGGHGKSLLAQQLATAVANGAPWLDLQTAAGPVLGLFCEDEDDELQRRQHSLFTNALIDPVKGSRNLFLDARPGKFNTLVSFGTDRLAAPTLLMQELRAQCETIRPALVILDNIAQLFAGQENARTEVTQFCNELTGVGRTYNCAVLLLGHTAKAEGSEYSGSTAWDAAVRSRLFLERQEDGTSILRKVKANYSALDEIRVKYLGGSFSPLPEGSQNSPEVLESIKPLISGAVEKFTSRQQAVSHNPTARNYLVKMMKSEQMLGGLSEKSAHATMVAMIDAGELSTNVILAWKTSSRHPVQGLAVAE